MRELRGIENGLGGVEMLRSCRMQTVLGPQGMHPAVDCEMSELVEVVCECLLGEVIDIVGMQSSSL